jgi:hypothetical protein
VGRHHHLDRLHHHASRTGALQLLGKGPLWPVGYRLAPREPIGL